MNVRSPVSRRDFFRRLRVSDHGRILEVSCRTLFMRCSDGAIGATDAVQDYEAGMGEPPAVLVRRSADDIMAALDRELHDVEVLRLLDPEWLENLVGGDRLAEMISSFQARGGRVERQPVS